MAHPIATYSFLPFLRQGIANSISGTTGTRATFQVKLTAEGVDTGISDGSTQREVQLYGPGDVIGIDPRAVIKTEPHHWITNFEPNYLAGIDFYDEDYPWRYSPLQANGNRLLPWLTLVVLKEDEFEEGKNLSNRPLPFFQLKGTDGAGQPVDAAKIFPKKDQLWAWAHVHVNYDSGDPAKIVTDGAGMGAARNNLQDALRRNPDLAYSRVVSPRKLEPSSGYHAFLIPSFESGRLAGVGDVAGIPAAGVKIAWEGAAKEFPYYYRWHFRTGTEGDFEYLVRLLQPKPADVRVGRRDMDMTRPGANLHWTEAPQDQLGGLLRLGGALRVPQDTLKEPDKSEALKYENWAQDYFDDDLVPPFQQDLSKFLNLPDEYDRQAADAANNAAGLPNTDADPIIAPPIYGQWHAMVNRTLFDRSGNPIHHQYNWLNELNLDPRFRVAAHFGTRVVQDNQEKYMQAAWEQVGAVIEANQKIRYGQFAKEATWAMYVKTVLATAEAKPAKALMLTAPVQQRILMAGGATVQHTIRQSIVPQATLSASLRRIARPNGRLVKDLKAKLPAAQATAFRPEQLMVKIADRTIPPAPPKAAPSGMPNTATVAGQVEPAGAPAWLRDLLRQYSWFPFLPLIVAAIFILLLLLLGASAFFAGFGGLIVVGLVWFWRQLLAWKRALQQADSLRPENQTPESVDALPSSGDFRLSKPGEKYRPSMGGAVDSPVAVKFKAALRAKYELRQSSRAHAMGLLPPQRDIALPAVAGTIVEKLNPDRTIPAWVWQQIFLPGRFRNNLPETFTEAMAYPVIDQPMYEPLKKLSSEMFLPNINLIEQNSITLLETNQKFIEAYMVGLNHEFSRELLWREYPTDQRGSYFRQFWDVSTFLTPENMDDEAVKDKYRDIPKLHLWSKYSHLGDHDARERPGDKENEIVLVIRGELLKKYPTAVIYANKADWDKKADGSFDVKQIRQMRNPDAADLETPPRDVIRTPLYSAKVDPDIYFFGFDLTAPEVQGNNGDNPTKENAGWFFVIKERPGEPRFGFDLGDDPNANIATWNDLSWGHVLPGDGVIDVNKTFSLGAPPPPAADTPDIVAQRTDDEKVSWNAAQLDAANLAYILYQVPVLVAVHGSEMLPK